MTKDDWLELTVLERKKYNYLVEIEDLTRQLAETLDRNDQVSARMLLAMRQDPILHLEEVERTSRRGPRKRRRARLSGAGGKDPPPVGTGGGDGPPGQSAHGGGKLVL